MSHRVAVAAHTVICILLSVLALSLAPVLWAARGREVSPRTVAVIKVHSAATPPVLFVDLARNLHRARMEFPPVRVVTFDVALNRRSPVRDPMEGLMRLLRQVSPAFDVVVVIGGASVEVMHEVAAEFPQVQYVQVDGPFTTLPPLPNLHHTYFAEEETAFVAGALAAQITRTRRVGFIGAVNRGPYRYPSLWLTAGFVAGAKHIDPRVDVLVDYTGFDIEAAAHARKWQQVARAQYTLGADVIFAGGPPALDGLLRMAAPARWVIATTGTAPLTLPDLLRERLVMRVVKDYGLAVLDVVRAAAAGTLTSGATRFTLRGGGVSYTIEGPVRQIAGSRLDELERIAGAIRRGEIRVPHDPQTLQLFLRSR